MSLTYRSSGVDIEAAGRAKERIQALVRRTHGDSVVSRPGLFGGAGRLGRVGEGFAGCLAGSRIPLIGGETAEMPGVLRPGTREVVGALFALRPAEAGGEGPGGRGGGRGRGGG